MDMTTLLVGMVVFLAVFTQSLSGFGVALVAMALLPAVIDLNIATPIVAIVGLVLEGVLVTYYRQSMDVRAVWKIALAAVIGTPFGVFFLTRANERVALGLLGVVIVGYALYALLGLKMPHIKSSIWAYLAGLLGGILGGAYNTSGPPVIIYANCRRWPPDVFKGNLQGYFIIVSSAVAVSHALSGNFTPQVWSMALWTLPFLAVGIVAGLSLDRWLNPTIFRRIVLVLLVLMGVRLMF